MQSDHHSVNSVNQHDSRNWPSGLLNDKYGDIVIQLKCIFIVMKGKRWSLYINCFKVERRTGTHKGAFFREGIHKKQSFGFREPKGCFFYGFPSQEPFAVKQGRIISFEPATQSYVGRQAENTIVHLREPGVTFQPPDSVAMIKKHCLYTGSLQYQKKSITAHYPHGYYSGMVKKNLGRKFVIVLVFNPRYDSAVLFGLQKKISCKYGDSHVKKGSKAFANSKDVDHS